MVNVINGHYEPIIFYNASWEVDQNMLTQTKHTNQPTITSIKQQGQNDLYLCMELMIICMHKNKNLKYHVKM
jgi:hypothetical protein